MLHLRQLQFVIIVSCFGGLLLISNFAHATSLTSQKQQKQLPSESTGGATVDLKIPGKYHAYAQQQQQHQSKKLLHAAAASLSTSASQHSKRHSSFALFGAGDDNEIVVASSAGSVGGTDLAAGSVSTKQQLNPIKNWFGLFNRNNSPPPVHDTQTATTCSCR